MVKWLCCLVLLPVVLLLVATNRDYRGPTKRLMRLLHTFCEKDRRRFQEQENEPFRATLLVAALCYAFDTDLRAGFRQINFPVSDAVYQELMARVRTDAGRGRASGL